MEESFKIKGKEELQHFLQLKPFPSHLEVELIFENQSIDLPILRLLQTLLTQKISINKLQLQNCKINQHFTSFLSLLNENLNNNLQLNCNGSLTSQSDLNVFLSLKKSFITLLNISSFKRISIQSLLEYYLSSHYLLSLSLDHISLTINDALILQNHLQHSFSSLKELSLRSCGFSRDENIFAVILSSLSHNNSLISWIFLIISFVMMKLVQLVCIF